MPQYYLTFDIGNTCLHIGLFNNNQVIKEWRVDTQKNHKFNPIILFEIKKSFDVTNLQSIGLSSVVPDFTHQLKEHIEQCFQKKVIFVSTTLCQQFFEIKYDNLNEIGPDRLCNILACQNEKIDEAIIIDFGTATTFDIYYNKTYWGGVICLGIMSSLKTLHKQASMLPQVNLMWNKKVTSQNTIDAIRNGVLFGTLGQIDYLKQQIIEEHHLNNPKIIFTGGLSNLIQKRYTEALVKPHFTLTGILHLIKTVKK